MTDNIKDSNDNQEQHTPDNSHIAEYASDIPQTDSLDLEAKQDTQETTNETDNLESNTNEASEPASEDSSDANTTKSKRFKIIGLSVAIGAAAIVAIISLVFFAIIPLQQQSAYSSAQEALDRFDFDSALTDLDNAGDSSDVSNLKESARMAKRYSDTIIKSFDGADGIHKGNVKSVSIAVDWMSQNYPSYPNLKSYKIYIEAFDAEESNLYEAYEKYISLGNFYNSNEKANSINTQIEQHYNEGENAIANSDWNLAKSNFESIIGYKDSKNKYDYAVNEIDMDNLANKLDKTLWTIRYKVTNNSYHLYYFQFQTATDSNHREGDAFVVLQSSNSFEYVGSYTYSIVSKDTIHMKGSYNSDGQPPILDFDGDVKIVFKPETGTPKTMVLNPKPVTGNFSSASWNYAGEANLMIATIGETGRNNGGYFAS